MKKMLDTFLVCYVGADPNIKNAMRSAETVAVYDHGQYWLWLPQGDVLVDKKDIVKLQSCKMSMPEIIPVGVVEFHSLPKSEIPDKELVRWSEAKELDWIKAHRHEVRISEKEARALYRFHWLMWRCHPHWTEPKIKECWRKAKKWAKL